MTSRAWAWVGAVLLAAACGGPGEPGDLRDGGGMDVQTDAQVPAFARIDVVLEGDGVGRVTGAGGALDCAGDGTATDCTLEVVAGTEVTLVAEEVAPSRFAGWSGVPGCGEVPVCVVVLEEAVTATAAFVLDEFAVSVAREGTGSGRVTGAGGDVDCGEDCGTTVAAGTEVVLTAEPDASSTFGGWSGGCAGTDPECALTVDGDVEAVASFVLRRVPLEVRRTGEGAGAVAGAEVGVDCGDACAVELDWGTPVTLTATAAPGSAFAGWTGCDAVEGVTCQVTLAGAATVEARFDLRDFGLDVVIAGDGDGEVTSAPAGIACPGDCDEAYAFGTRVTLTATANPATSRFAGWGGACSGAAETCEVAIGEATSVTARFTLLDRPLTVRRSGTGTGTVTSSPAGVSCGSDCTEDYAHGTSVTLTASATAATSSFEGWSGACSGTSRTCVVSMTAARTVTAEFTLLDRPLTVRTGGTGDGTVTGTGVDCGSDCTEDYAHGTSVTLTASADASSTFEGWSGACSGRTTTCVVSMTAARTVTAEFAIRRFTLTVNRRTEAPGTGTVTGTGISCGSDCTQTFDYGTRVTLTASPGARSVFDGWGGACSGTATTCTVTMTANRAVSAAFGPRTFRLVINMSGLASDVRGTLLLSPGTSCSGSVCFRDYVEGTRVTITPRADTPTTIFSAWGGECLGTSLRESCTVTMDESRSVSARWSYFG